MATYSWTICTDCTTSTLCPTDFSLMTTPFQAGGQEILTGHILVGQEVTEITGTLKNPSSVSGNSVLKCYSSANVLKATSGNISNSAIGTSYETVTFDLSADPWTVAEDDYFLVSTDTGNTMKIQYTNESCMSNTNGMEKKSSDPPSSLSVYDWIGTATYTSAPTSTGTRLPPPPLVARF